MRGVATKRRRGLSVTIPCLRHPKPRGLLRLSRESLVSNRTSKSAFSTQLSASRAD